MDANVALKMAEKMHSELSDRRADIERAERYYRGDQPLAYASDEWSELHRRRYREFSDNWCGVVGSAPSERLKVQGFRLESDSTGRSGPERALRYAWESNDLDAQASQGFLQSTIAKRSFALVWGNSDDEPVVTWEHPSQVLVSYDPESRERRAAIKSWSDGDVEFLTLYTADEVFKWQRAMASASKLVLPASALDGGWEPRQGDGDDTWPVRNPLGEVPVVEFANRPMLGGEPLSDIDGTMAMQDAVNLLWAYLFVAADYASMPARVVLGQEPPVIPILDSQGQPTGQTRPVDTAELKKGRMLWLTGQSADIKQWDAAKLDVFTDVINIAVRHVAAQTRTPIYLVHGELGNVNGETLTGLDAPLVSKVRESHTFYQRPMRQLHGLMANVMGDEKAARQARVGVVDWADPAIYSVSQLADAALKDRQLGLPLASILEARYGYTDQQIERVLKQIEAESQDPYLARIDEKNAAAEPEAAPVEA